MKGVKQYRFWLVILAFASFSCKKEYSLENARLQGNAIYSLQDAAGNCTLAEVHGNYKADSTLSDSNYVYIHVNFTTTGKYYFSSDILNGIWFIDSGYVQVTGPTVIKLKAYGKPILPIISSFLINNNANGCGFSIIVTPADDYLPSTLASTWKYGLDPSLKNGNGSTVSSFDVSVTDSLNLNGKKYILYYSPLFITPFNFAKQDNDYWEFNFPDFDYTSVFDMVDSFREYIYLKTNQPINTTWNSPEFNVYFGGMWSGVSNPGKAYDVFTIVNIYPTYTLGSNTFKDVITVRRDIMFQAAGTNSFVKVMDGVAMYAKGVGLINQEINLPNGTIQKIPLVSWTIK